MSIDYQQLKITEEEFNQKFKEAEEKLNNINNN